MKQEWFISRKRYIPAVLPLLNYFTWPIGRHLDIEPVTLAHIWSKGWLTAVWEKKSKEQVASKILEKLSKKIKSLEKIRQEGLEAGENVVKCGQAFATKSKTAKFEEFLVFFHDLEKLYNQFIQKSMLYWLLTSDLLEQKIKALLVNYKENEQQEIFKIMSVPEITSYSKTEEDQFNQLVEITKKNSLTSPAVQKAIKNFSEKYFWFPYEYVGPDVWDVETVTKRINEALKNPIQHKITLETEKEQKACLKKYGLSKKLIDLFKILQLLTIMQDDRKMHNAQACYYVNNLVLGELAKRLKVNLELARYLDVSLLKKFIDDKNGEELLSVLKERSHLFLTLHREGKTELYTCHAAQEKLKELGIVLEDETSGITELTGRIANQGKAKGRVKILITSSGAKDFKTGDILIAPMTTPDFVPLMTKAAAIVTDEGGMTCHAAIVSRELNIPCLVGTNLATKVFKDDDLVEVDAIKGIVRKIE